MNSFKTLALFFFSLLVITSCQKEVSLESGTYVSSIGTLKSNLTGDCLPSNVNGIFRADIALTELNYIDVQLDVATVGSYYIVSDTLNGFSFKGTGTVAATGLTTVRLQGSGKPTTAGTNTFTIRYGASFCSIDVNVISATTGPSTFTLGGAPGACTGAVLNGIYKVGTDMDASHSLEISVDVTATGTYTINVAPVNGILFSGTSVFTTTGIQTVTLSAVGSPLAAGTFNTTASNGASSNCTISITVLPASGTTPTTAIYSMGGAGSNCTGVVLNGNYMAGTAMGASNTATMNVTVNTAGTYTISTAAVNGVTFSGTGSFTATGPQTVTLTASGTPTAAATSTFQVTGNASTCAFPVTFIPAAPPAVFTLEGAGGTCTSAVIAGTYSAATAMGASNTVTISANVTTAGPYSITTNTVNGMTFSASGVFAGTGPQSIILVGTGTPTASGSHVFTPQAGTSSCTFTVPVTGAATDYIKFKINGGPLLSYTTDAMASLDVSSGFPILSLDASENSTAINPSVSLGIVKTSGGTLGTGTYTVNQVAAGIILSASYYDASNVEFFAGTDPLNQSQSPAFTITITSITATRVVGTFSGPVKDNNGAGPGVRTLSEGAFNLPIL